MRKKIEEMTAVHKQERVELSESYRANEALLEKNFDKYKIDAQVKFKKAHADLIDALKFSR